jgi:hypothetical protein
LVCGRWLEIFWTKVSYVMFCLQQQMRINIRFTAYFMVILGRDLDCYLYSFMVSYTREW